MRSNPFIHLAIALALLFAPTVRAADVGDWRGINIGPEITDSDLQRIHDIGFNVVRLSMNRQPLMNKQSPYNFDEAAFTRMKAIVASCAAHGLKVILDPHTTPGTTNNNTTSGSDPLWHDRSYGDLLVRLWGRISKDYNNDATVVGYDLLNEPATPRRSGSGESWNDLAAQLVKEVRQNDHKTTIIVESSSGPSLFGKHQDRIDSVPALKLPADGNIALSIHVYVPMEFTHQGVRGRATGVRYPGMIGSTSWNKAALEAKLAPVQEFAAAHHVKVFVGEFSASRFGDAASTDKYLSDLLEIFDKFGWGWAYHSYGAAYAWSLEPGSAHGAGQRAVPQTQAAGSSTAPSREDLLRRFLKGTPAK